MEARKERERDFRIEWQGKVLRTSDRRQTPLWKWYTAGSAAEDWIWRELRGKAAGKRILDYGCGDGDFALELAGLGAHVTGIDLCDVSVAAAKAKSCRSALPVNFRTMDAEHTDFEAQSFDFVICRGVVHHLNVDKAFAELSRILDSHGEVIVFEPMGYNPLINWYRKRTPQLRTADEHPLLLRDLRLAQRYFGKVRVRYFNLMALLAAPLWKSRLCGPLSFVLSKADSVLLRVPVVQLLAWRVVLTLAMPSAVPTESPPTQASSRRFSC